MFCSSDENLGVNRLPNVTVRVDLVGKREGEEEGNSNSWLKAKSQRKEAGLSSAGNYSRLTPGARSAGRPG
jgi:hypothetical protein